MGHKYLNKDGILLKSELKNAKNRQNNDVFEEYKRFFVERCNTENIVIDGEEHNHISNVMRCKIGDLIILVCNDNFDYVAKIVDIQKKFTIVKIEDKIKNKCNPTIEVTAFVALNKKEQTSLMVRMLSELGISFYVPISTKWTLSQDVDDKILRYQKIADQSAKQCRRSKTLKILGTKKLADIFESFKDFDIVFFANEDEKVFDFNNVEESLKQSGKKLNEIKTIAFIIGPVAGFDVDEQECIKKAGAVSISLGKRILRADTACVALASILINKFEKKE